MLGVRGVSDTPQTMSKVVLGLIAGVIFGALDVGLDAAHVLGTH
jgi:hypothetical protein